MSVSCKDCENAGLCVVRQKVLDATIIEFPDGKAAVFDLENSLSSCDHYRPPVVADPVFTVDEDYHPVTTDHSGLELPSIYQEDVEGQISAAETLQGPQTTYNGPAQSPPHPPPLEGGSGLEVRSGTKLGERRIRINVANLGR